MRLIIISLIALVIATGVGLGMTWTTSTRGLSFDALKIGPWTAWPRTGTAEIDPYARASVARSGELPIGSGDGVAFVASQDDKGRPLWLSQNPTEDDGGATNRQIADVKMAHATAAQILNRLRADLLRLL